MGFRAWSLGALTAVAACAAHSGSRQDAAAPSPRDSVVQVQRVDGLSFAAPVGVDTILVEPSTIVLYLGDSLATRTVAVVGRDSVGAAVVIPAPVYAFARQSVAELRGEFIRALRPGRATLYVLYDWALWRRAESRPEPSEPFAEISVIVRPRR